MRLNDKEVWRLDTFDEKVDDQELLADSPPVIAVDFDGCLCESRWPDIGSPYIDVIDDLKFRQSLGCRLILWTCRTGKLLHEAVGWCKAFGLTFDAINDNLPDRVAQFGGNPRKVSADQYWDDKSIFVREGRVSCG